MMRHTWTASSGTFDLSDTTSGVWLTNGGIEGEGNPETEAFESETPMLDGQTVSGWRALPRDVFWPIVINQDSEADWLLKQRALWRTLRPLQYGLWRVTQADGTWRELSCRFVSDGGAVYLVDPSIGALEAHGITLVADDPWWRGADISKTFQTAETPEPFYAVTTDRVFNLMSSNTVDNATINNPGDVPTWLVHRFDGPLTGFTIGYSAGIDPLLPGENVTASLTLNSDEWAILDTSPSKQSLLKYTSGGAAVTDVTSLLEAAGWARVEPGENQPIYVELNGAGSMTSTLTPLYYRAF